jgi:Tim44-like domain
VNRMTLLAASILLALTGLLPASAAQAENGALNSGSSSSRNAAIQKTGSADESPAGRTQTNEAEGPSPEAARTSTTLEPVGVLLLLLFLGAATIFYYLKIQRPSLPDFSGLAGRDPALDNRSETPSRTQKRNLSIDQVTSADKATFQQLLSDVHAAWSRQDLAGLGQFVTPDMVNYFSAALADHTNRDIQNHVEDVILLQAEVLEAWMEGTAYYVSAGLRWSARDYNLSLTKQRGEPGYVVTGSEETPTESRKIWTFVRDQDGKWLLSAIQH